MWHSISSLVSVLARGCRRFWLWVSCVRSSMPRIRVIRYALGMWCATGPMGGGTALRHRAALRPRRSPADNRGTEAEAVQCKGASLLAAPPRYVHVHVHVQCACTCTCGRQLALASLQVHTLRTCLLHTRSPPHLASAVICPATHTHFAPLRCAIGHVRRCHPTHVHVETLPLGSR